MIVGLLAGVLILSLLAYAGDIKPYCHSWVMFGSAGALIGHFVS